ncbi:MAG: efflux RND transporter periplasmic adaptor subunit [Deltaproteobacteria bacterium]
MRYREFLGAVLAAAMLAAGCSGGGTGAAEAKKEEGPAPVSVEAERVTAADLHEEIEATGTLAPRREAVVKSEFGGTVAEMYVTQWVRVKRGDPLARVDSREAEAVVKRARAGVEMARAALLEAEAGKQRAEREFERTKQLLAAGLATRRQMDDARTERDAAQARYEAAEARRAAAEEEARQAETRASKAVLRAPFDGVVAERMVTVGEVVGEMQKALFRIVDNRLLDLTLSVPSGEMRAVRVGQPVLFRTDAFPGETFRGTVKFINPSVDPADRSVKVIAEVPNPSERLKGGLFVRGTIRTGTRKAVLLVPRSALFSWDLEAGTATLFLADGGIARSRTVRTGIVSGDRVQVTDGIREGDHVVTRGGFNVRDGDRIRLSVPQAG